MAIALLISASSFLVIFRLVFPIYEKPEFFMDLFTFFTERKNEYIKALQLGRDRLAGKEEYETFVDVLDNKPGTDPASFRHDILIRVDKERYFDLTMNVPPSVYPIPEYLELGQCRIVMESFVWNGCEIHFMDGDE